MLVAKYVVVVFRPFSGFFCIFLWIAIHDGVSSYVTPG